MSALHILRVPCPACDHAEAHKVRVLAEEDGFESRNYAFVTPEYCPKCRTLYSVNDMMELASEIRGMVDEQEAEYREHRTGKRQRIA